MSLLTCSGCPVKQSLRISSNETVEYMLDHVRCADCRQIRRDALINECIEWLVAACVVLVTMYIVLLFV